MLQVVLGTTTYEPVAVASLSPPDDDVLTCAVRVTLHIGPRPCFA